MHRNGFVCLLQTSPSTWGEPFHPGGCHACGLPGARPQRLQPAVRLQHQDPKRESQLVSTTLLHYRFTFSFSMAIRNILTYPPQSSVCLTPWRRCVQRCLAWTNSSKTSTMSLSLGLATVTCHRSEK